MFQLPRTQNAAYAKSAVNETPHYCQMWDSGGAAVKIFTPPQIIKKVHGNWLFWSPVTAELLPDYDCNEMLLWSICFHYTFGPGLCSHLWYELKYFQCEYWTPAKVWSVTSLVCNIHRRDIYMPLRSGATGAALLLFVDDIIIFLDLFGFSRPWHPLFTGAVWMRNSTCESDIVVLYGNKPDFLLLGEAGAVISQVKKDR